MSELLVTRNENSPCEYVINYGFDFMNLYIDIRIEPKGTICCCMHPNVLTWFMEEFEDYAKKSKETGLINWMHTEFMLCNKIKDRNVPIYYARIMDLYFGNCVISEQKVYDNKLYYPASHGVMLDRPKGFEFILSTKSGSSFTINFLRTGDILIEDTSKPTFEGQRRSYRIESADVSKYILDISFSDLDSVPGYTYDDKKKFLENISIINNTRNAAIQNRIINEFQQLVHVFSSVYQIDNADMNDPKWNYDKVEYECRRYGLHLNIRIQTDSEDYTYNDGVMHLGFILTDDEAPVRIVLYGYLYEKGRVKIIDEDTLSLIKECLDPSSIMYNWLYEDEEYILNELYKEVFDEDLTIELGTDNDDE